MVEIRALGKRETAARWLSLLERHQRSLADQARVGRVGRSGNERRRGAFGLCLAVDISVMNSPI